MVEKLLCPSMMCANFANLEEEVKQLDEAGFDIFHIDIMDGSFVPNFGMGLQDYQYIRRCTNKLMDAHLMIQQPSRYIDFFCDLGADIIYIHPESEVQLARALAKIASRNKKAGIVLNPATSLESVKEVLPIIDYLMIMTVNPGFAGQKFLDYTIEKIKQAVVYGKEYGFEVVVDGAISPQKIAQLSKLGVKGFVLGTSAVFGKEKNYQEIENELRGL